MKDGPGPIRADFNRSFAPPELPGADTQILPVFPADFALRRGMNAGALWLTMLQAAR